MIFNKRADLPAVLKDLGLASRGDLGVEVGVQRGYFSSLLLSAWPGYLMMVDPWKYLPEYKDAANVSDAQQEAIYQEAKTRCAEVDASRFTMMRNTSLEAADIMKGYGQDISFVYLDADHSYESVKADLEAWWPLIRSGGVLAGHDWVEDGDRPEGSFGVRRAVAEFFQDTANTTLYVTSPETDGGWQSWLVVKK